MIDAGTHDTPLVLLSGMVAVLASFSALDLAGRTRTANDRMRAVWLFAAAVAMGGGIWAMHFVAMLAFRVPGMEISYDPGLTILSAVIAITATGVAFGMTSVRAVGLRRIVPAGLLMGCGVVGMHYIGMAAMRMSQAIRYEHAWLIASILIAIGASIVALWLAGRRTTRLSRILAALAMGAAIAGMHFAGMRAARFTMGDHGVGAVHGGIGQTALALAVAGATLLILMLSLVATAVDRRLIEAGVREADALRRSEEEFRLLYLRTPLPLFSLDSEGRLEQVSNNWIDLLGYTRDEVIGRPLSRFLEQQCARDFALRDWPMLLAKGLLEDNGYTIRTRDGTPRDVIISAKVEREANGAFVRVLGGLTDVTERHIAERALRQAQKIEVMGQLTEGVAHDFNNLLAVIVGSLDLLQQQRLDAKSRRLVVGAMHGAQRGMALTQRLLAFARRQDLKPKPVDVAALLSGMDDLLRRSLGPTVAVSISIPATMPPAYVDAGRLELALLNLAVNARDAMPQGGELRIAAASERLAPGNALAVPPGAYIRIGVVDHGRGMDATTLARAADPFFTTKPAGKGNGLGLSMVHSLAAESGGALHIRSESGAGTSVELLLPATVRAQPAPARTMPSAHDDAAVGRAILVVDDDDQVRANTGALLEDMGHHVTLAASGEDALEQLARDARVELVVTDQLMPGMLGTQLVRQIHRGAPAMPVLIVSGYAELTQADAGVYPTLAKPFTRADLAHAVNAALAGAKNDAVDA